MPLNETFAMPSALQIDESTATRKYACFTAMPWEKGFGHTIGNSLRRILLSCLEGVAVTQVRIDGVPHEFSAMPDVQEDVMEIVLNLKKLRVKCDGELPRTIELEADKAGAVTAAMVKEDGVVTVLNPELHICTLSQERPLRMEIQIDGGRGYRSSEQNKSEDQPIGVIPVDSLFSPVERVRYEVEACRVGNITDYDQLIMEVWTDGRVAPKEAVRKAARIMQDHLGVFVESPVGEEPVSEEDLSAEEQQLLDTMCRPVTDLKLSVRANNCLQNAGLDTFGRLLAKSEAEMLKQRNFGKKSLDEIKERLEPLELSFDLEIPEKLAVLMEAKLRDEQASTEESEAEEE